MIYDDAAFIADVHSVCIVFAWVFGAYVCHVVLRPSFARSDVSFCTGVHPVFV